MRADGPNVDRVLFIESLPFRDYQLNNSTVYPAPHLPIFLTHHEVVDFPAVRPAPEFWKFDTGYGGQALYSPTRMSEKFQLRISGTEAGQHAVLQLNDEVTLETEGIGKVQSCGIYLANLWLYSNRAEYSARPLLIPLAANGIALLPGRDRGLIGRKAFHGSGIEIKLDYEQPIPTLSVWVPRTLIGKR
jgi:hypothetical protein